MLLGRSLRKCIGYIVPSLETGSLMLPSLVEGVTQNTTMWSLVKLISRLVWHRFFMFKTQHMLVDRCRSSFFISSGQVGLRLRILKIYEASLFHEYINLWSSYKENEFPCINHVWICSRMKQSITKDIQPKMLVNCPTDDLFGAIYPKMFKLHTSKLLVAGVVDAGSIWTLHILLLDSSRVMLYTKH